MIVCDSSKYTISDIIETINNGYTALINVIYLNNEFYILKNNIPLEKVNKDFLKNQKIIVCCCNLESFYRLNNINSIHCFSYDFNEFTSSSKKFTILHHKNIPLESFHLNDDFVKDLIVIVSDNAIPTLPKNIYGVITKYPHHFNRFNFV